MKGALKLPRAKQNVNIQPESKQPKQTDEIDYKAKNAELEEKINMLMAMMEQQKATEKPITQSVSIENKYQRRIQVTNISDWGITLKTSAENNARQFRFDKFGVTLPITYEDLCKCINTDIRLFQDGYLYIHDEDAVKDNYLEQYYEKMLDADKISNIMSFSDNEIISMISNASPVIQRTICTQIANKILRNETVDYNKVKLIGKACTPPIDIDDLSRKLG